MRRRLATGACFVLMAVGATAGLSWALVQRGGIPLDGRMAGIVYALTESAGAHLVPLLLVFGLLGWATDPELPRAARHRQSRALFVLMLVVLPTAGALNEYVVKPAFAIPRPSHLRLHAAGVVPDLEAFERLDPPARREFLETRLAGDAGRAVEQALRLHPVVLRHWIAEVGSTFPSGHALNAFIVAMLFVGGACLAATRRRRWLAGVWLVWSIAVALSRCLLLVHRPIDVTVGALAGTCVGLLCLLAWWRASRTERPHATPAAGV